MTRWDEDTNKERASNYEGEWVFIYKCVSTCSTCHVPFQVALDFKSNSVPCTDRLALGSRVQRVGVFNFGTDRVRVLEKTSGSGSGTDRVRVLPTYI